MRIAARAGPWMKSALIIEDLPDSRIWLQQTVETAFPGITVSSAGSLADGRSALGAGRFDLALIDLGLPDGSGIDLVAEIARTRPPTKVVVATVFDDDAHLWAALRAGADGYVLKHHTRQDVAALLRGIEQGQPPLSPPIARRILSTFHRPSDAVELTEREREVLGLIARGHSTADAARTLSLSPHTVHGHVKVIYQKLGVSSRAEAALEASRQGLMDPG